MGFRKIISKWCYLKYKVIMDIISNKIFYSNLSFVLLLICFTLLIIVVSNSIVWVAIVTVLYIVTSVWGTQLMHYVNNTLVNYNDIDYQSVSKVKTKNYCSVCSDDECKRHKQLSQINRIEVPKDFDKALEGLLEQLLESYVRIWYSDFSANEAFLHQLRLAMATAVRNVTTRILKSDTSTIVFDYIIPLFLNHINEWKIVLQESNGNIIDFQGNINKYKSLKLHPAAYSSSTELNYLRAIVTKLMPHLLPATHISTNNKVILREILSNWILLPAIDAFSNPENINTLMILLANRSNNTGNTIESANVPLLQSWIATPLISQTKFNSLKPTLDEILDNPELLYLFMQHIKESGPVNLLQFCLDIDDLSKRMLNPEMTEEIEETLFNDVQNLYTVYLDPKSPEYLHLPMQISQGMYEILRGGPTKIQELRTSKPLYEAHQEAHSLLEVACLPSFHHCYQLYNLMCGQHGSNSQSRSPLHLNTLSGSSNMGARLSSQLGKISRALRASAIDGSPFDGRDDVYHAEEVDCSPRSLGEIDGAEEEADDGAKFGSRDFTAWRVTVPHVDSGERQNQQHPIYMVAVHSVAENKSWTVLRRDQDFYHLRTRLIEFHGDQVLSDSPLPSRKNPHVSLASNRQIYQEFLQKLLTKPTLRGSELVYTFLTSTDLKQFYANCSTPDIGILYQSMAHKLRKERGQHLDRFMNVFLASTNTKQEHEIGAETLITDDSVIKEETCRNEETILNEHIEEFAITEESLSGQSKREFIKGACFCIAEAVNTLTNVPSMISRIFWMFACLSRRSLDPRINQAFYQTLVHLLSEGRASIVIKLLQAKIINAKNTKRSSSSNQQSEDRFITAKEGLRSLLPWWLVFFYKPWYDLIDSTLNSLQNSLYNKHLVYYLLDSILVNLFPEIKSL